jgi:TRAP-type C4-dicarboxylate transport system substrate-binding protein
MTFRLNCLFTAAALFSALHTAQAADVTLRFHQFLPPQANVPHLAIEPWAKKVEKDSGGRIKVQLFPSMQLGGKPPELYDQAKDGVADVVWAVLGFTPGRFPKTEAFELPFTVGKAESGSRAFQEYVEKNAMDEFKDVKLITVHVHGPGLFHSKDPINRLEDLKGMKVRGGSRVINIMLEQLGATPVGMPVTSIGESLSKGVISATTIPFEVVPSLKVEQIVKNHTTFSGDKGLYTLTFAVAMNKRAYERLPADLKKVIDANSGIETAALFGRAMDTGDVTGRAAVVKAGNNIVALDAAETQRWARAAAGVRGIWYTQVAEKGIDGKKLAADAEALIAKHAKK